MPERAFFTIKIFVLSILMLDDIQLEETLRLTVLNLMVVLYDCGITEIHLGGLMRILGVDNEKASRHDNERVTLDDDFVKYVEEFNSPRPANQLLH
jgi:hypothetical protein